MSVSKRCSKCLKYKLVRDFYTDGPGKVAGWCKVCKRANEAKRRADKELVRKFHDRYETDLDFRSRELLRACGKRCRIHGLAFDLDVEWLAGKIAAGRCELTGLPFNLSVRARKPTSHTPSIDRIQAGRGYTKDNCRVVLYAVNAALNAWGLDVFMEVAEALVDRHARRVAA